MRKFLVILSFFAFIFISFAYAKDHSVVDVVIINHSQANLWINSPWTKKHGKDAKYVNDNDIPYADNLKVLTINAAPFKLTSYKAIYNVYRDDVLQGTCTIEVIDHSFGFQSPDSIQSCTSQPAWQSQGLPAISVKTVTNLEGGALYFTIAG